MSALIYGTHYTISNTGGTTPTITFLSAAGITHTSVLTVKITKSGYNVNSGNAVTIPNEIAQTDVNAVALSITSIPQPAKDQTLLTMPTVPAGYTIAIKTSNNTAIATNKTITPPINDTSGTLVLTVTHTASGKTADTAALNVTVPAKTPVVITLTASALTAPDGTVTLTLSQVIAGLASGDFTIDKT